MANSKASVIKISGALGNETMVHIITAVTRLVRSFGSSFHLNEMVRYSVNNHMI